MLHFENINVHILGAQVLRNVNLKIESASNVTIIGRNGAGKTTLFRTLMGLIKPTSGTITLDGESLSELDAHIRPGIGIGYAPEDRRIFKEFTVEQNIELPGKVAKLTIKEVKERLDRVYDILPELKDLRQRSGGSISGGQGKIVALGRALMIGTKLVLLDEPLQGLAPALAMRYSSVLHTVKKKNPDITIIITESSPDLLRNFGNTMYQIERGEITLLKSEN